MQTSQRRFQISFFLLAVGMATLPFTIWFQLPVYLLLLLNFVTEQNWKGKYKNLIDNNLQKHFIFYIGFYILYVLGLIHTTNFHYAFSDLECKIALLLLPCFVFTLKKTDLTKERLEKLFLLFIFSYCALILVNFGISLYKYTESGNANEFLYQRLSHFMHPSYSALYANTIFLFILHFLFVKKNEHKSLKIILLLTLPLLTCYILLLQSKAGILMFGISVFIYLLYLLNKDKKRPFLSLGVILICCATIVGIAKYTPLAKRFVIATEMMKQDNANPDPKDGTQVRRAIWKTAWETACEKPIFGFGTGDVKDVLTERYKQAGFTYITQKQFNTHNQYLQTFLALGLVGACWLIGFFVFCLIDSIKKREMAATLFWFIVLGHFLVESMFEQRAGSDFVALMGVLFCYYFNASEKPEQSLPEPQSQIHPQETR